MALEVAEAVHRVVPEAVPKMMLQPESEPEPALALD